MTTQLLFYDRIEPISAQSHGDLCVSPGASYEYARHVNAVPLMAVEFPHTAPEYPIVFTRSDEGITPVVLLGAADRTNLFVTESGSWDARYVPAFVRRYPFVIASPPGGEADKFTLCIDESFEGCNREGRGERLFGEDGAHTPYLERVLGFVREYHQQFVRTREFCRKIDEAGLLEPMHAQFTLNTGEKRGLTGFMAINRAKLKALPGDTLAALASTDELELAYIQLQSMQNFARIIDRAASRPGAAPADGAGTAKADGADAAPKAASTAKKAPARKPASGAKPDAPRRAAGAEEGASPSEKEKR